MKSGIAVLILIFCAAGIADYFFVQKQEPLYLQGSAALKKGNYKLALDTFGRALRDNPHDPVSRVAMAKAYLGLGMLAESEKEFEMAVQKSTLALKEAYVGLEEISEKNGHREDAKKYFRSRDALEKINY